MAQLARPDSDISFGTWATGGGPSTLWECLDEVSPNDFTDYIFCFDTGGSSTCEVGLSAVTDPAVSTGHVLRVQALWGGGLENFVVSLKEGANLRASFIPTGTGAFETSSYTLSAAEADSIADYSALSVQLTYTGFIASTGNASWVEFEVPSGGPVITTQPQPTAADESATAQFSVSATGTGALTYQWQRAERYSETFTDIGGATSSSYTTGTLTQIGDHLARYRCVVTDTVGSIISNSALLSVEVEGNFVMNDTVPLSLLLEFAAPASAKSWGWFGFLGHAEESAFESAPAEWSAEYWWLLELAFNEAQAGGGPTVVPTLALLGVGL